MSERLIREREKKIIEDFEVFDDPLMQYDYIIDLGKSMPVLDEALKTEDRIVKGCQSIVWLASSFDGEKVHFKADSNTVITKGIIALLIKVLSDLEPESIIQADLRFIDAINLRNHLSEQRSNGLNAMIKQMKLDALAYNSQKVDENQR